MEAQLIELLKEIKKVGSKVDECQIQVKDIHTTLKSVINVLNIENEINSMFANEIIGISERTPA